MATLEEIRQKLKAKRQDDFKPVLVLGFRWPHLIYELGIIMHRLEECVFEVQEYDDSGSGHLCDIIFDNRWVVDNNGSIMEDWIPSEFYQTIWELLDILEAISVDGNLTKDDLIVIKLGLQ